MARRISWRALAALAVAFVMAAPLQVDAQSPKPIPIKIGYLPFLDSLPVLVAQEKGFFAKEGLETELSQFRFGGVAMEALVTKRVDIAISAFIQPSQIAAESGLYCALLHPLLWEGEYKGKVRSSNALMVKKDSRIHALKDFKGKSIAVAGFGSLQYFALQALFKRAGMDPRRDVKFIELPYPNQAAALDAGKIDGIAVVEPFLSFVEENGIGTAIVDPPLMKYRSYYLSFGNEFPVSGLWAHPDLLAKYPDASRRIARAMAQGIDWMYANQDQAYDIGTKWLKLDRKFIRQMVENGGYWKPYPNGWTERDWEALNAQMQIFEQYGGINKPVNVKRLVEFH